MLLVVALSLQCAGCAYFNTYYNGKRFYDQAQGSASRQFPDTLMAGGGEAANYQKALDKFAAVVRRHPSSRWSQNSLFYMGLSYYYTRNYQKAERKFQEVWEYYPGSKFAPLARLNAAVINWLQGDYDRAATILMPLRNHPDRSVQERAAFLESKMAQDHGDRAAAVIAWERYLFKYYKGGLATSARLNYALCLMEVGEVNNAIRELEIVAAARTKRSYRHQVWLLLGQAYARAGRNQDAAAICSRILSQRPDNVMASQAEILLAGARAAGAPLERAMELYQAVANKYPSTKASAQARYDMGLLMEQNQQLDSALTLYKKARSDAGASQLGNDAMRKVSNIALLLSYQKEASQTSREQSAVLQFLLAEHFLFGINQPDSAVAVYRRVAREYPDQPLAPKALFAAAWASEHYLSDRSAADSLYRGVIAAWPSTRYANGARDRLGLPLDGAVDDVEPDIEFKTTAVPVTADTAKQVPARETPGQEIEPDNPKDQPEPPPDQPPDKKMIPGPDDLRKSETR